jgi:co-chaperonin GroES (HSP10)
MKFRAVYNHIIFKFLDEIDREGRFVETTSWGFRIPGVVESSAKTPRWGVVTHIGPGVTSINVGQQILITALKWTTNVKLNGEKHWQTDEKQINVVRESSTSPMKPTRDTVIFKRHNQKINQTTNGLHVVGDSIVETPKGTVVLLGPDCVDELKDAVIYYSEVNFFNKFEHEKEPYWYIAEQDVLLYTPAHLQLNGN